MILCQFECVGFKHFQQTWSRQTDCYQLLNPLHISKLNSIQLLKWSLCYRELFVISVRRGYVTVESVFRHTPVFAHWPMLTVSSVGVESMITVRPISQSSPLVICKSAPLQILSMLLQKRTWKPLLGLDPSNAWFPNRSPWHKQHYPNWALIWSGGRSCQ